MSCTYVQFISLKAREVSCLRVITTPLHTLTQTLCPRPTSRFSSQRTIHSHTNSGDLVLVGLVFLFHGVVCAEGAVKVGLCSECEVRRSNVSLFSTRSGSTSTVGGWDTHLLYGILLSLHLAVTMAAAIKRFSSHTHYLISPHQTPHRPALPTYTHNQRKIPLLIFIAHIFWAQRNDFKAHEVLSWKGTS